MQLINNISGQKLRGGFYTPEIIANFILKWGVNETNPSILEPSCGEGVFLQQLKNGKYKYKKITAIEIDKNEAKKADKVALRKKLVINKDFHVYCNNGNERFDLIVGNPPYIRYQYFNKKQQIEAEKIFTKAKLKYSKLTNAWVSFVIGSSFLLKEKGKMGFVLPAEILQVSYAKPLRNFLSNFYNKINIISFKRLVFPDIQQEVILLLCEKNQTALHLIEHLELDDAEGLKHLDVSRLRSPSKKIDFKSNKWTFYFLEQKEIDFLEMVAKKHKIPILGDFADVEVGITTGSNEFFTVPLSILKRFKLQLFAEPLVGRSVQVKSPIFTRDDWLQNRNAETRAHLLAFPSRRKLERYKDALEYLSMGERKGINKGYKCRIRNEWQIVPSIWIPEALFIRRNNLYPKLILNQANAYSTDTMHRIKIKKGVNTKALVASFYNSLSFAFAEILGRSYGGGVLELMPSETEKILLPYKKSNSGLLAGIDLMMRDKKNIEKILEYTNNIILKKGYGFSNCEIKLADTIWKKLSSRRLNRNNHKGAVK